MRGAGNGSSRGECCLARYPLEFVWAPSASPDTLGCVGQACPRLDAKFKAGAKDGEGREGMSPAGTRGLVLFEELLQFRWLMGQQVPFLLGSEICSGSAVF